MSSLKKALALLTWAVIANTAPAAFAAADKTADIARDKTLVVHYAVANNHDPVYATNLAHYQFGFNVFETLMVYDADNNLTYGQAQRYEVDASGTLYTFHLREGLKWSDGVPLTAHDFELAWKRVVDPDSSGNDEDYKPTYLFLDIKNGEDIIEGKMPVDSLGVSALDDRTLQITLEHSASYFPTLVSNVPFSPIPSHVYEKFGNDWDNIENFVSNGPYTLAAKGTDKADLILRLNPHFRGR